MKRPLQEVLRFHCGVQATPYRMKSANKIHTELRRSPRKKLPNLDEKILEKSSPSNKKQISTTNSFGKYRIPRKTTSIQEVLVDSVVGEIMVNSRNAILNASEERSEKSKNKLVDSKIVHPVLQNVKHEKKLAAVMLSKPTSTNNNNISSKSPSKGHDDVNISKSRNAVVGINQKSGVREIPLKAKRRLPSTVVTTSRNAGIKTVCQETISPAAPQFKKMYEDLPDYEDSVSVHDEEEDLKMELDNQIPKILKLIKDETDSRPSTPTPVLKSQNDITEMEVDADLPTQRQKQDVVVVVPDTNIWISELKLMEKLINEEFSKSVRIVIPWMVLQELDVRDHQRRNRSQAEIRRPIKFIHNLLLNRHPRVRGQKAAEAAISKLKFDELVADDSILGCAMQNHRNNNTVIFVSNDTNLLNKAIVNGITAVNSLNLIKTVKEVVNSNQETTTKPSSSPLLLPNLIVPGTSPSPQLQKTHSVPTKRRFEIPPRTYSTSDESEYIVGGEDVEMQEDSELDKPMTKIRAVGQQFSSVKPVDSYALVENALLKVFSYIIRRKMVEDYGMGGWEYALKVKPPWTLATAIKCMLMHWIANFSYVFTRRGQPHLENLKSLITSKQRGAKVENQIVDCALSLLNFLEKQFERDEPVLECKRVLLYCAQSTNSADTSMQPWSSS